MARIRPDMTALHQVLAEQRRLIAEYEVQRARANNLDDIRETARSQARSELAGVLRAEERAQSAHEAEVEGLITERDRLRRKRAELNAWRGPIAEFSMR